jgi:hypothetical protein
MENGTITRIEYESGEGPGGDPDTGTGVARFTIYIANNPDFGGKGQVLYQGDNGTDFNAFLADDNSGRLASANP